METIDKIIQDSKISTKEEENAKLLKILEPISLSLFVVNKYAKKERDEILHIQKISGIEKDRVENACKRFNINYMKFSNNELIKSHGYEFYQKDIEKMREILVNEAVKKSANHPFQRMIDIKILQTANLIEENKASDWIKFHLNYIDKYSKNKNEWKNHVEELPEFNYEEMKFYMNKLYDFVKIRKSYEKEIKEHEKTHQYYYDLKDAFFQELKELGFKADELHLFGTHKKIWRKMPYIHFGGFTYHVLNFPLVENYKKYLIPIQVSSKCDIDVDIESAKQSLLRAIAITNNYNNNKFSFDEAKNEIEKIINDNIYLKDRKELLENQIEK